MSNPCVLILAGQRAGVVDPLCAATGVSHKAIVPVAGTPMLYRVVAALDAAQVKKPYFITGYDPNSNVFSVTPHGEGPADSVLKALQVTGFPVLVTTCDHALLSADMIAEFLAKATSSGADICAGLASREIIETQYPTTQRTYLKFSDISVSGCNLFYVSTAKGLKAVEFWRDVQHLRKTPFKLARRVGLGVGLRYLSGRLSLDGAFAYLSKRVGLVAKPVLLSYAEAAIDVDKPADLALVENILAGRTT